ncbi:MAG: hypothetical protein PHI12_08140 [Dehalococcoidales bacterium]|jgi:hypothetical protein|nr:hypothetical protein [Dehalococcoidales bacterium]
MGSIIDTAVDGAKKVGNDVVAVVTTPIGPFTAGDRIVSDVRRTIRGMGAAVRSKIGGGYKRRY